MKRFFFLLCVILLISCQDKVICPAYQSTYILDDSTRFAYYSYVWQLDEVTRTQFLAQSDTSSSISDSLSIGSVQQPKTDYYAYAGEYIVPWRETKRTKYGIVKPVFVPIKKYRMRTAPMVNVLGPEPISNEITSEELVDTLSMDSLSLATRDSLNVPDVPLEEEEQEKTRFLYGYDPSDNFNVEQLYYNKYFADRLIDTSPLPEPEVPADTLAVDSLGTDSIASKKPFLKGLFKKRKKESIPESEQEDQNNNEALTPQGTEEEEEGG